MEKIQYEELAKKAYEKLILMDGVSKELINHPKFKEQFIRLYAGYLQTFKKTSLEVQFCPNGIEISDSIVLPNGSDECYEGYACKETCNIIINNDELSVKRFRHENHKKTDGKIKVVQFSCLDVYDEYKQNLIDVFMIVRGDFTFDLGSFLNLTVPDYKDNETFFDLSKIGEADYRRLRRETTTRMENGLIRFEKFTKYSPYEEYYEEYYEGLASMSYDYPELLIGDSDLGIISYKSVKKEDGKEIKSSNENSLETLRKIEEAKRKYEEWKAHGGHPKRS